MNRTLKRFVADALGFLIVAAVLKEALHIHNSLWLWAVLTVGFVWWSEGHTSNSDVMDALKQLANGIADNGERLRRTETKLSNLTESIGDVQSDLIDIQAEAHPPIQA